jgi:hypothetical protein
MKRSFRRLVHKWEGNIKKYLTDTSGDDFNWIKLSCGRV